MEGLVYVLKQNIVEVCDCVVDLLCCVGLVEKMQVYFLLFLGGQQQWVVIVCVFVMQFEVILFDELIFVLDLEMVGEVLFVMCEFVEQNMMMLVVIYEIQFVCEVVDSVVFLVDGYIVEQGFVVEVLCNLMYECMQDFLCCVMYLM